MKKYIKMNEWKNIYKWMNVWTNKMNKLEDKLMNQ